MSNNPPAKHHYTPQFLIAQWARHEGKLWRFTKPYGEVIAMKRVAPAEIGYQKQLYATPGLPPAEMQIIEEKFMSPLDSAAAESHQLLLAGQINGMPQKQRSAWSRFIMSQWFRTPENVTALKSAIAALLAIDDPDLTSKYEQLKQAGFPDTLEQAIAAHNPHFAEQTALGQMCKFMDDPDYGHRLNNMLWFVREIEGGHELLVSDVIVQQPVGVFSLTGYITIPIGPRKLFFAVHKESLADKLMAMPRNEFVHRANRAIVRRSSQFVGASDLSQKRFIEKNLGEEEHETLIKGIAKKYESE